MKKKEAVFDKADLGVQHLFFKDLTIITIIWLMNALLSTIIKNDSVECLTAKTREEFCSII